MERDRTERGGQGGTVRHVRHAGHAGHAWLGGPSWRWTRLLGMLLLLVALVAPLAGARAAAQADGDPTAKAAAFVAQGDDEDDAPVDDDATVEAEEDGADEGDDAAGGDDAATYESPLYGYTLTYDPGEWEVYQEDDDPDDEYDAIYLANGVSTVAVFGDPDYDADELDTCVEDYLGGLEGGDGVSEAEPLDERGAAGDEDDRVWATYAYVFTDEDGDEGDFVRYFECRVLGDGVTLVTVQDTAAADYEDEVAAREDLLEGLDASTLGGREADDAGDADSGDDAAADDAETPEADPDGDAGDPVALDGDWEGESEDGVAFSFVVEDGGVLSVSYGYECDGEPVFAGAANSDPTPIEDGEFVFETESSSGTTTVTGTISADGEAEGTLERETSDPEECDVEFGWTAEAT